MNQLMKIKEKKANLAKQAETSEKINTTKVKKEPADRGQASWEPSRSAHHKAEEYEVFSSEQEDSELEATVVTKNTITVKKENAEMSTMPGRKTRKEDSGGSGVSGSPGGMNDEEETSMDFEDVDEIPDEHYHEMTVSMTDEDKLMVDEQCNHYLDAIKEAWSMMGLTENKNGMKVMELCCEENSGLGQAVEAMAELSSDAASSTTATS